MIKLPPITLLIQRCRALAALDLILSPEWESRFYSFNSRWAEGEMMASMRDGCGDEWWVVFHREGRAALKGLGHESAAWSNQGKKLSEALQRALPEEFRGFAVEPAFQWDATSFAYYHAANAAEWVRVNDLVPAVKAATGEEELLAHLVGGPADYAAFAADYYETKVDVSVVTKVFALEPITADIVTALNPAAVLEEVAAELYEEIGYPRGI